MGHYVVLDLEMCRVHKQNREIFPADSEIIQIGSVLLDDNYQVVDTFSTYVRPEYGEIDSYIRRFTGISSKQVASAPSVSEALAAFSKWMPEDAVLVAWSESDELQIKRELAGKAIHNTKLDASFGHWIDCQALFGSRMESGKRYKLSDALLIAGLFSDGRAHNALADADNTALLFAKLARKEQIRANYVYIPEDELDLYVFNPYRRRSVS